MITLAAVIAVAWYASQAMQRFYEQAISSELTARARIVERHVSELQPTLDSARIDVLCKQLGELSETRITVMNLRGKVLGDSDENPTEMEDHSDRPEVRGALAGEVGTARRFSSTLQQDMLYKAVPLRDDGAVIGAVRVARSMAAVEDAMHTVHRHIGLAGLIIAVAAIVISLLVTRRIVRPLRDIKAGAERFAKGELGLRLTGFESEELDSLATTMNQMAEQLSLRIRTVNQQRGEAEAVLSSMVEGVLAVNNDENVIRINEAACRILSVEQHRVIGKNIQSVARCPGLQQLLAATLASQEPVTGEVVLHNGMEKFIRVQGAQLLDERQQRMGAVLVLNDLTQLRQLENLRRDFVANVSHEIRTPITTIQGFVETLIDGAAKDEKNLERFLDIILKQTRRLNAIVEDLLLLSRIESAEEQPQRGFEERNLKQALQSAIAVCEPKAQAKEIAIELHCPPELTCRLNVLLFEQAVINLIDNAVNYSPAKAAVHVRAGSGQDEITVAVQDVGCGIPAEHIPRLFERFYRVDKARSRQVGGTGLGLAIVKHVVQEHGGHVTVASKVGQGSTFTIHLPRAGSATSQNSHML